jgi:hypothetical protein
MGLDAMRLQAARLSRPELLIEKRETLRQTGDRIIEIPLGPSRPNSLPGRRTAGSAGMKTGTNQLSKIEVTRAK